MIDEKFRELVESGIGCVVILAGSGSDDKIKEGEKKSHIEKIADSCEKYGVPYEVRVCSAHKQLVKLDGVINEYNALNGLLGIITVAGGTDAVSGAVSFHSVHQVVSCPPDAPNDSCVGNPPGSSNAYIVRPENVGRFFAQAFSHANPAYKKKLLEEIGSKIKGLQKDDADLNKKYAERQGR